MLARTFVETIATVISLAIEPTALARFHDDSLNSTKCVGWAKAALPSLGQYYGMFSDHFVHFGRAHAAFERLVPYTLDDEAFKFIVSSMRGDAWLLYLAAELVHYDEVQEARYWKPVDNGVSYSPSDDERQWMTGFLINPNDVGKR